MKKTLSGLLSLATILPMMMGWYESETMTARRYLNGSIRNDVERVQGQKATLEAKQTLPLDSYILKLASFNRRVERNMYEIKNYVECTVTSVGACTAAATRKDLRLDRNRSGA